MKKPRIFIDGQAGTTGLQIHQLLANDDDIDIISIDEFDRKKEHVRRQLLNDVDVAILCLPDDAAKDAVSWIKNDNVRVLDASSAHRVASGWVYGFRNAPRTSKSYRSSSSGVEPWLLCHRCDCTFESFNSKRLTCAGHANNGQCDQRIRAGGGKR